MEKMKLYGVHNGKDNLRLIIGKTKAFYDNFGVIWKNIRLYDEDPEFVHYFGFKEPKIKKNLKKREMYRLMPVDVSKVTDVFSSTETRNYRIEIFYGYKKIHITIYTSLKNRKRILNDVVKHSKWTGNKRKTRI